MSAPSREPPTLEPLPPEARRPRGLSSLACLMLGVAFVGLAIEGIGRLTDPAFVFEHLPRHGGADREWLASRTDLGAVRTSFLRRLEKCAAAQDAEGYWYAHHNLRHLEEARDVARVDPELRALLAATPASAHGTRALLAWSIHDRTGDPLALEAILVEVPHVTDEVLRVVVGRIDSYAWGRTSSVFYGANGAPEPLPPECRAERAAKGPDAVIARVRSDMTALRFDQTRRRFEPR